MSDHLPVAHRGKGKRPENFKRAKTKGTRAWEPIGFTLCWNERRA